MLFDVVIFAALCVMVIIYHALEAVTTQVQEMKEELRGKN